VVRFDGDLVQPVQALLQARSYSTILSFVIFVSESFSAEFDSA
jgi:hypothetical protein